MAEDRVFSEEHGSGKVHWFFYDEAMMYVFGPFESEEEAIRTLVTYDEWVAEGDFDDEMVFE